jgi:transposase InsO family protein
MQGMVIQMNDEQFLTLAQLQAFLDGTLAVDFSVLPAERYNIIARTVHRFGCPRLRRAQKAVVLRFLERVSAVTRASNSHGWSSAAAGSHRCASATAARAPTPNNRPGYLRLDSVHQGDQDGLKGIYHVNAVDCVTQFEAVATCERLSEAYLLPVLEEILLSFPFVIRGFHSDNGSEYINRRVAELLNKMLIEEHTKSRSRESNDNDAAQRLNDARARLFKSISNRSKSAA